MFFVLVTVKREAWRKVAGDPVSRQVWRCVAFRPDYMAADEISERYHRKNYQTSVVEESALKAEQAARYREEAACASRSTPNATTSASSTTT